MPHPSRRWLAVLTAVAIGLGLPASAGASAPAGDTLRVPADQPGKGLVYRDLLPGSAACAGLYRLRMTGACTHGPDAPPPGLDATRPVAPATTNTLAAAAAPCVGDGVSGNRVQVLYVHGPNTDRYNQYKASFLQWTQDMDTIYNESAKETGGTRHLRFVHDAACQPVIANVAISSAAVSSFDGTINALKGLGYTRTDRKYALWVDSTVYCGIGEFTGDDRKTAANQSNFGPMFARSDSGCWDGHTMAHEIGHNLGAVSYSAPNSSGGAHCTDEYDVMCYSDSPNYPPMRYVCNDRAHEMRFDCNHNDYFHTSPPAGSYLATHWNVADSVFLIAEGGGPAPGRIPGLTVRSADSQETSAENGAAANAVDGNPSTIWHTQWSGANPPPPHEIQLDLHATYQVTSVYYLPRQTGTNGRIARYEVYVSADGVTWGTPVATGTWTNTSSEEAATFAARAGRYVKLRALSEVNGNPWTSAAEIAVAGT
ncbi:discoidin domain-containing protein [Longispora sp. K20-0274]|uniref:discoidin domain-containing protein n=1 Tax=Longispora sp. K20-0274 TaxID=3088255 RepID=UPI00399982AD